jgi:hypothetical protein
MPSRQFGLMHSYLFVKAGRGSTADSGAAAGDGRA